tara:strand:+ start:219 stop:470 length:252 start_codon:yes stop_codon:yes gene_type:complete
MAKSQLKQIKSHLEWYDTITSWEAIQKYHITRLSAIIYTLRHEVGMNISSSDKRAENGKNWVEYKLIRESDEGQFNLLGRNDA